MQNLAKYLSVAALGIVMMPRTIYGQDSLGRIRVGAPFPDLDLPRLADGGRVNVEAFRGKPTVLIVFASW